MLSQNATEICFLGCYEWLQLVMASDQKHKGKHQSGPQVILAKPGRLFSRPSPREKAQKLLVLEPSFLKLGLCKS